MYFCKEQRFTKMGLQKGHTNNLNGRPKGSSNKVTRQVREVLADIVEEELNNLPEILKSLEPRDRAKLLIGFLTYVAPRLQNIAITPDQNAEIEVTTYVIGEKDNLEKLSASERKIYLKLRDKCKEGNYIEI